MVLETTHFISSTIVNNAPLLNNHYQLNAALNNILHAVWKVIGALLAMGLPSLELKVKGLDGPPLTTNIKEWCNNQIGEVAANGITASKTNCSLSFESPSMTYNTCSAMCSTKYSSCMWVYDCVLCCLYYLATPLISKLDQLTIMAKGNNTVACASLQWSCCELCYIQAWTYHTRLQIWWE